MHHYLDQGRHEKALETAEMVADVYCGGGLVTMAQLKERMDRHSEAERWYKKNEERYGDVDDTASYPLLGFYYRMARVKGVPAYQSKLERLLARVFPQGLEPLPRKPDAEPPKEGVLIDGNSKALRDAGLRGADVIVGLDGRQVRSLGQYDAILWFQMRTWDMNLRVWRQSQYLDLKAHVPGRHFGVRVRTFGTPGPSFEKR